MKTLEQLISPALAACLLQYGITRPDQLMDFLDRVTPTQVAALGLSAEELEAVRATLEVQVNVVDDAPAAPPEVALRGVPGPAVGRAPDDQSSFRGPDGGENGAPENSPDDGDDTDGGHK